MLKIILSILIFYTNKKCVLSARPKVECGYKQCPQTRDGALNVHLIPHSHMDAGWVKTFDEYYYGTRTTISTANVQLIYHSVLSELLHDKRRKFTFSETAYFWRWWKEQRPATRATFRTLVQEGRIEFAGGGWVQNDEATLDYLQIIDHFTWGLRKLNDTLGPCGKPKASWQIDTYGHSREQTSLLAQMGYDGLFIGRVDHREREAMIEEDRMEFMWRGSDTLGKMSDIMTHTLYNLYNAPEGFCFDFLCSDEPIVDDPDNQAYNAEKRVNDFIAQIERQAKYYDHDNIMVTMGGDFTYQSAANWFMNMDKLINHVNTHPGNITDVNIFYSTPSCYLKAIYLYGRRDKAIYTERNDHLPYGSDGSTYWTGYYSSRPSLKYFIRRAHVFLQVVKQLTVIAKMGDSFELHLLRHATNLVLHHDAITGTSQQHVTNDFIRTLSEAVDACTKKVSHLLSYLTPTWGGTRRSKNSQQFVVCHQLNISQCRFTDTQESMLLLVYNPLSVKTYFHVRLPAIALHYSIRDFNDEEVEYQLVPIPTSVINLPGRTSTVIQELCFEAENIPPLGYVAYYISPVRDQLEENEFAKKHAQKTKTPESETNELVTNNIANEYLKVTINKDSGLLESIQHVDGAKIEISQNFHYYSQVQQTQQSGAYCFRPENSRPTPVTQKVTYNVVRGSIVKEIRQRFSDWITQVIRLYRGEEFVEFEWVVGPVPIGTDLGKEVVTIFSTNVTNSGQFYTDSNGRQMMRRTCWNESSLQQQKKPVSSCYYPVTSRICLQSLNTSMGVCVLTDRAQGGTSYVDGQIELMIHRRLLTDDGFGLEESLNEEAYGVGLVVKGKHRVIFGNLRQDIDDLTFWERIATTARRWQFEPWLFMTSGDKVSRRKWQNVRNKRYSALRLHGLPRHVHILTLEPWKGGSVLLRLENTLQKPTRGRFRTEKSDGPEDFINKPSHITVQLRMLFVHLKIKRVRETTLAANQWLDDARQMDWSTRYVYQGADDEILPEDNVDYRDDKSGNKDKQDYDKEYKEPGPYSEEEGDYGRNRKPPGKRRKIDKTKAKSKHTAEYDENYRRKRSVNNSENILENTINGTFNDKVADDKINEHNSTNCTQDTTERYEFTTRKYKTTIDEIAPFEVTNMENISLKATTETYIGYARNFKNLKSTVVTRKSLKRTNNNNNSKWLKPNKFLAFEKSSEEFTSSEEDFSSNLKKRSPKRRKYNKTAKERGKVKEPEAKVDTSDDGITKSIYEMYYKSPTKPKAKKELPRSSEENIEDITIIRRRRKNKNRQLKNRKELDIEPKIEAPKDEEGYEEAVPKTEMHRERDYEDKATAKTEIQRERDYEEKATAKTEKQSERDYEDKSVEDKKVKKLKRRLKTYKIPRSHTRGSIPLFVQSRRTEMRRSGYDDESGEEIIARELSEENADEVMKSRRSLTRIRRGEMSMPPDYDGFVEGEEEMEVGERENKTERRKRATPTEEATDPPTLEQTEPSEEPDYIITLRPTQIRTFIIYFDRPINYAT